MLGVGRHVTEPHFLPPSPTPDLLEFQVNKETDVVLLLS